MVEEAKAVASIQMIKKGAYPAKMKTEFLATAIAKVVNGGRRVNDEWKVTSYGFLSISLHGKLENDGTIRGVLARTDAGGRGGKGSVESLKFILRPLPEARSEEGNGGEK
jgi:hypothetical protein